MIKEITDKQEDWLKDQVIAIANSQLGKGYLLLGDLDNYIENNKHSVLVEFAGDEVKGFCLVSVLSFAEAANKLRKSVNIDEPIGYISMVATLEKHKREGIASKLVEAGVEFLKGKSCKSLVIVTWKSPISNAMQNLVEKLKFQREFKVDNYWYMSSLQEGYECPECGNPCRCSAIIYKKNM